MLLSLSRVVRLRFRFTGELLPFSLTPARQKSADDAIIMRGKITGREWMRGLPRPMREGWQVWLHII